MTRKELIKAIYKTTDLWSCPNDPCDLPEEEGNTGECCWKCAEKQLAKYEAKIRAKAIKEYKSKLRTQFLEYYDKHGYPCLSDIMEILDDCEIELKEQKK